MFTTELRMKKLKAFTIRIPTDLHDQIEAQAVVNRRTKNAEIIHILEQVINAASDQKSS